MKNINIAYVEVLRTVATIAVVFLHINMTLPANCTKYELGIENYAFFECCYMLVCWAVPVFIMISGALLLNSERKMNISKIWKYIKRMIIVLLTFGTVYAFMEIFYKEKTISLVIILKSFLYVLEGKSWDHLWYLYTLIGLYILTIPLRVVVEQLSKKDLEILLAVLSIGNFLIPTINGYTALTIEHCMLIDNSVVYYLLGYYLSVTKRDISKWCMFLLPVSILSLIVTDVYGAYYMEVFISANMMGNNIFRAMAAVSLFVLAKKIFEDKSSSIVKKKVVEVCLKLKPYSFGIYMIHPFFINFIFKVLKVTPLSGSVIPMSIVLWVGIYILSLGGTWALTKIPIIQKYI